jgi:hypothetical protein
MSRGVTVLERFLVQSAGTLTQTPIETPIVNASERLPDLLTLRQHRLAPYAYRLLPPHHPDKTRLRPDMLTAAAHHEKMKRTLVPLLRLWANAGIEVLLFKGFYLAEFVYNTPALRFYGDVDMLIDPKHAATAEQLAADAGWRVVFSAGRSLTPYIHELLHLRSPDGGVFVEVHRRVLQNYMPAFHSTQTRLTAAAWQGAGKTSLEDVPVWVLQPSDAVLLGLVLNRFWSEDNYHLHARDYLDMHTLLHHFNLDEAHLRQRAKYLHCTRTFDQFWRRCNPLAGHVDLSTPNYWQRQRWNVATSVERPYPTLERYLAKALRLPGLIRDISRQMPLLLRVLRTLKRTDDVNAVLEQLDVPVSESQDIPLKTRQQIVRGVKWGLTLLRVRPGANCLPRTLAIYVALRKRGANAMFCSGFRRHKGTLEGHAWVELNGFVLDELHEPLNPQLYHVNVRHPPDAA